MRHEVQPTRSLFSLYIHYSIIFLWVGPSSLLTAWLAERLQPELTNEWGLNALPLTMHPWCYLPDMAGAFELIYGCYELWTLLFDWPQSKLFVWRTYSPFSFINCGFLSSSDKSESSISAVRWASACFLSHCEITTNALLSGFLIQFRPPPFG